MTYESQLERRALEALVDKMMDGERYPSQHAWLAIDLYTILSEHDYMAGAAIEALRNNTLESVLEKIVREYVDGSTWHTQMIATMREDEQAAALESAMESKRERSLA